MADVPMEEKLLLRQKLLDNSFIMLKNLNKNLNADLHKNITQSVIDLVNCYFCLDKVKDPLLCPKCNNFACKECLKHYFGSAVSKPCGLCKQQIKFSELKENKVVKEIEKILSADKTQKRTVEEFAGVIKEKQDYYKAQQNEINELINGFNLYKGCLERYKFDFNAYLVECQKLVEQTFNKYYNNIQNLIKSLLSYYKIYQETIEKYDEIYRKARNNFFNNDNIKELINEILYMEKKQINNTNKLETKKFLLSPIHFKPYFRNFSLLENKSLNKENNFPMIEQLKDIGTMGFKIDYFRNEKIYKCQLLINTKKTEYDRCFLVKFCKKGETARDFIMKLMNRNGLIYYYEFPIGENYLFCPGENNIKFSLDILEMDTFT